MDISQKDIDALLELETALGNITFDKSIPIVSEQYITSLLEKLQVMFVAANELPPIITKLKDCCKHRLIPFNIDSTTTGYCCIDCDRVFEAYGGNLKMPDADFMEISSPERI